MYYQKLDDFVGLDDLNSLWGLGAVSCKTLESRKNSAWRTATTQQRQRDAAQTKLDACATKNARRAGSLKDPYHYCEAQQKVLAKQTTQYTTAYNKAMDYEGQLATCQAGAGAAGPTQVDATGATLPAGDVGYTPAQLKKIQAAKAKAEQARIKAESKAELARIKADAKAEQARIKADAKAEQARLKAEGKSEHTLRAAAAKEIAMARASCKKSGMIFQLTSAYPAEYVCNPGYQDTSVPAGYTDPSTLLPPDMTTQPPPPGYVDPTVQAPPPAGAPAPLGPAPLPYGTVQIDPYTGQPIGTSATPYGGAGGAGGAAPAGFAVDPSTGQLVPDQGQGQGLPAGSEVPADGSSKWGWLIAGGAVIAVLYFMSKRKKK